MNIMRLREIVMSLLTMYKESEITVISEYSGHINEDIDKFNHDYECLKTEIEKEFNNVNTLLSVTQKLTLRDLARKVYPSIEIRIYGRDGYQEIEEKPAGDIHFSDDSFYQVEVKDFTIYKGFVEVLI